MARIVRRVRGDGRAVGARARRARAPTAAAVSADHDERRPEREQQSGRGDEVDEERGERAAGPRAPASAPPVAASRPSPSRIAPGPLHAIAGTGGSSARKSATNAASTRRSPRLARAPGGRRRDPRAARSGRAGRGSGPARIRARRVRQRLRVSPSTPITRSSCRIAAQATMAGTGCVAAAVYGQCPCEADDHDDRRHDVQRDQGDCARPSAS